ncbi:hypothetical protein ACFQE0_20465 [Methylobacterium komagatae]|uniref:Uncharacterized protein n=1 Tax=Methylobacterium komagatae TaxID=374425 RepID=A0ABW2BQY5_9HYPH|nr:MULTISPECIES: hypothetical protein [Methylobacterium]PVZ05259.1 hypothetical protein C7388_105253 [Methylobacterium organophilum]
MSDRAATGPQAMADHARIRAHRGSRFSQYQRRRTPGLAGKPRTAVSPDVQIPAAAGTVTGLTWIDGGDLWESGVERSRSARLGLHHGMVAQRTGLRVELPCLEAGENAKKPRRPGLDRLRGADGASIGLNALRCPWAASVNGAPMGRAEDYRGLRERLERKLKDKEEAYSAASLAHFREVEDLRLQIQLVDQALQGGGTTVQSSEAADSNSKVLLTGEVPRLILRALEEAEPHGLSGGELNAIVVKANFAKDSAEKNKTKLRLAGRAHRDPTTGRWRLGPGRA